MFLTSSLLADIRARTIASLDVADAFAFWKSDSVPIHTFCMTVRRFPASPWLESLYAHARMSKPMWPYTVHLVDKVKGGEMKVDIKFQPLVAT